MGGPKRSTRAGVVGEFVDADMPAAKPVKRQSRVPVRDRRFVAWDGEGSHKTLKSEDLAGMCVADFDPNDNAYFLFGCSTGDEISSPQLCTSECLSLITRVGAKYPDVLHCAFAFNYDVTMITRDLSDSAKSMLKSKGYCFFGDWRLEWMKSKWFRVTHRPTKVSVCIYDVFTFFGCSAMKAWEEYLGKDDPRLVKVGEGKDNRPNLRYADLWYAQQYMRLELEMYAELVEKLRKLLGKLDLHPAQWYGPGAVSRCAMEQNGVRKAINRDLPEQVLVASQHAYFGGRFEQFQAGLYEGPVYDMDIRSAYPHALRLLPNLNHGFWQWREITHDVSAEEIREFSLYRVRYWKFDGNNKRGLLLPSAFPFRRKNHTVHYPNFTEGWYWGCEVKAALTFPSGKVEVVEAWEFIPGSEERPFKFIEDLYYQRAQWRVEENPVQLAAKLVINSIYGKLAQRVGAKDGPPSWHQLEYAGFTTAKCRSMVYSAMMQSPQNIIAVETDGIYSRVPLDVPLSPNLGDWDCKQHESILYVQNGVYWTKRNGEWEKARIRGFGTGDLTVHHALDRLDGLQDLTANTHRFAALSGFIGKNELTYWIDREVEVKWGGNGKRVHLESLCAKCQGADDMMHDCAISFATGGVSYKHTLPWKDKDRNVYQLSADEMGAIRVQTQEAMRESAPHTNRATDLLYEVFTNPVGHRG